LSLKLSIDLESDGQWLADLLFSLTDMDGQPEIPAFRKLREAAKVFTRECLELEREAEPKEWYLRNWIAWAGIPNSNPRKVALIDDITRGLPDPTKARDFLLSPIMTEERLEQIRTGDPPRDLFEEYALSCNKSVQNYIQGREKKGLSERCASRLSILFGDTSASNIVRKAKQKGFLLLLKTEGGLSSPQYKEPLGDYVWSTLHYLLPAPPDAALASETEERERLHFEELLDHVTGAPGIDLPYRRSFPAQGLSL
jgi:hypothetical protein